MKALKDSESLVDTPSEVLEDDLAMAGSGVPKSVLVRLICLQLG